MRAKHTQGRSKKIVVDEIAAKDSYKEEELIKQLFPKKDRTGKSGFAGVYVHTNTFRRKPYEGHITVNQVKLSLGMYATAEEAARAHDKAARIIHGDQAILNFPDESD